MDMPCNGEKPTNYDNGIVKSPDFKHLKSFTLIENSNCTETTTIDGETQVEHKYGKGMLPQL